MTKQKHLLLKSNDGMFAVVIKPNNDQFTIFNCSPVFQYLHGKLSVSQIKMYSSTFAQETKEGINYQYKIQDTRISEKDDLDKAYKKMFKLLDGLIDPIIPKIAK